MAKLYNYMVEISNDYGEFENRYLTIVALEDEDDE